MPLLLLQLGAHPDEIAATKIGAYTEGGAFFLDFSRPLRRLRWLLVWNERVGYTMALCVPVVHEGQAASRLHVAVDRGDPYFAELQRLWAARHPAQRPPVPAPADAARVARDFAEQFPTDARTPC